MKTIFAASFLFISMLIFGQEKELKGIYLDENLVAFQFERNVLKVSGLEFGTGDFYAFFKVDGDTLILTKDLDKTKSNLCETSVFCDKTKLPDLRFFISLELNKLTLKALNVPAELLFSNLYKRTSQGIKEEKNFLKNTEMQTGTEGSASAKYYAEIRTRNFTGPDPKDQLNKLILSTFHVEQGVKHYFDLEYDSTGYFVARDLFVDATGKERENDFQGQLSPEEIKTINNLYIASLLGEINPDRLQKRTYADADFEFAIILTNRKKTETYTGAGSHFRFYMQPFAEFIKSSFRQTKFQSGNHSYKFSNLLRNP